jgi:anti-sigma factor RsiW
MQCDRAQEFFSDFLDQTIDRPLAVAVEAHLAECSGCRRELEALQSTCELLSAMPEVEPPADGAWQVMRELQKLRVEQWEAQRARTPSLLDRLRALNPLSVAMGAGLATLVFAGGMLLTPGPDHTGNRFDGRGAAKANPRVVSAPSVEVSYGALTASGQQLDLRFVSPRDLVGAQMTVTGDVPVRLTGRGNIRKGDGTTVSVNVPLTAPAAALHVQLSAPGETRPYQFLVVAPVGEQQVKPVSLSYFDQPLDEALRRLAPYLGKPVVVEDGVTAPSVSLQAADRSAADALDDLAGQARATAEDEGAFYRLVRAR